MPRVRVSQPSSEDAQSKPRQVAIYYQAAGAAGEVDSEVLNEYVKLYGSGAAKADGKEEMSFAEFAGLFAKAPTHNPAGEGNCLGLATEGPKEVLAPKRFTRRHVGDDDVRIQITHAGICHSDIHQARDEWGGSKYPMVPGHEIAGIVTEVGRNVTKFKVGDRAGIGCMVNSCRSCKFCCDQREEQFCKGAKFTYNDVDVDGTLTQGGYSTFVVVRDHFALRMPQSLSMAETVPLLCAGITVYTPIKHFGLDKPGMRIGVAGLGGLGHCAVKLLVAMGIEVTVISSSDKKRDEAIKVLGAAHYLSSRDEEAMKAAEDTLDGMINTISATIDIDPLLKLVKPDGTVAFVGLPDQPLPVPLMTPIAKRLRLVGSMIGGIERTQEMLDFCDQKKIGCMIEEIPIDKVNEAYERVNKSDVRYRFVIDILGSLVQE